MFLIENICNSSSSFDCRESLARTHPATLTMKLTEKNSRWKLYFASFQATRRPEKDCGFSLNDDFEQMTIRVWVCWRFCWFQKDADGFPAVWSPVFDPSIHLELHRSMWPGSMDCGFMIKSRIPAVDAELIPKDKEFMILCTQATCPTVSAAC